VIFADDCVGDGVKKLVGELHEGQVLLLENLRFHPEEEANDDGFSRELASLCDAYVDDAFGTVHRAHASTVGMVKYVPQRGAGFLVLAELKHLQPLLKGAPKPYLAILAGQGERQDQGDRAALEQGGRAAHRRGDGVHVPLRARSAGGGFAGGEGQDRRRPPHPGEGGAVARRGAAAGRPRGGEGTEAGVPIQVVAQIPEGMLGLDIGPKAREQYRQRILGAKTVFWNGPMGLFEVSEFAAGTLAVAEALAEATSRGARTVVGGGDSAAACAEMGMADKVTHVSTGGGASLEFLEGRELRGSKSSRNNSSDQPPSTPSTPRWKRPLKAFWLGFWSRSDRSEHLRREEGKMINRQNLGVLGV